jgi:sigma-54 dependent transcriptional regulator, acetoin dehydrogenase operon transcriptional activator AcoR
MHDPASLPVDPAAQRLLEQRWETALTEGAPPAGVRSLVRDSWTRALQAQIRSQLPHAPLVWDESALFAARDRADWLPLARQAVASQHGMYAQGGHVLTLFDAVGRMLVSEGEPGALDGLAEIGFRPGSLWAEHAVGTNGPGTALVTGRPVHIVGAEHFCEAWQPWHCAAVPIRDPASGDILGVIDISGRRDAAHPHTLTLSIALAMTIEQMLARREAERRVRVLNRLAELAGRWPGDTVIAVDRRGLVIGTSSLVGSPIPALAADPERLRTALVEAIATAGMHSGELRLPGGTQATLLPVWDGAVAIGACLVVASGARAGHHSTAHLAGRPQIDGARVQRRSDGNSARYSLHDLVGQAPSLVDACRIAFAAAANTLPVLIHGESGTGKEVFAQGIHAASDRTHGPFVAVNCAALPRELIESELFGYVGGAFSGARREGSAGKFEVADGGTIFLDEITELSPAAQAALLRVLQEGEVTRVGATRSRRVNVRVIAATNRDLDACLAEGSLREDLFYRLSVLTIELPPLRRRPGDIARLAEHFLAEAGRELERPWCRFGPGVLEAMRAYAWPGNVRELRNLLRRLVALASGPEITSADLPIPVREAAWNQGVVSADTAAAMGAAAPEPLQDDGVAVAREELRLVIEQASSMQEAAARLGITRSTLYRRLERYGLRPSRTVRR